MRTSESICSLAHSSPVRERQREGERRGEGWPIYLQSLLPPLLMFASPHFCLALPLPFFLWQIEAQGRNVAWLNTSDSDVLPVVFSLIGSSKAATTQAWPRRRDPTGFFHSFLILSCISNSSQSWPTFPIQMCDETTTCDKTFKEGKLWQRVSLVKMLAKLPMRTVEEDGRMKEAEIFPFPATM